jgi:hypothetical protein
MIAAIVIFVIAAGLTYHIHHTAQPFMDTTTVAFVMPGRGINVDSTSLLAVNQIMATYMMSPAGKQQVRSAGGVSDFDMAMVNLYNEDFPNYGVPYSTISASSPDPAEAQSTLTAVMRVLQSNLASRQASQGTHPGRRVGVQIIAPPSGPIEQTGSPKRTLAGLIILILIVGFMLITFLDRHPIRFRGIFPSRDRLYDARRLSPGMRIRRGTE